MAGGQSPPGQPGFTIRPLKPDNEIPGGGRQYWLKRDDRKCYIKYTLNITSNIQLQKHYIEQLFIP